MLPATAPATAPSTPKPEARSQACGRAAGLARELDAGAHGVVGRDHLALAEAAAAAHLAALLQFTLAHHVVLGAAALDDDEAVALLDHQAQHRQRGAELVFAQLEIPGRVDVLFHRQRAQGFGALLEGGVVVLGRGAAGGARHRALVFAHLGRGGHAACQGRHGSRQCSQAQQARGMAVAGFLQSGRGV
jgi:hypothetical protein